MQDIIVSMDEEIKNMPLHYLLVNITLMKGICKVQNLKMTSQNATELKFDAIYNNIQIPYCIHFPKDKEHTSTVFKVESLVPDGDDNAQLSYDHCDKLNDIAANVEIDDFSELMKNHKLSDCDIKNSSIYTLIDKIDEYFEEVEMKELEFDIGDTENHKYFQDSLLDIVSDDSSTDIAEPNEEEFELITSALDTIEMFRNKEKIKLDTSDIELLRMIRYIDNLNNIYNDIEISIVNGNIFTLNIKFIFDDEDILMNIHFHPYYRNYYPPKISFDKIFDNNGKYIDMAYNIMMLEGLDVRYYDRNCSLESFIEMVRAILMTCYYPKRELSRLEKMALDCCRTISYIISTIRSTTFEIDTSILDNYNLVTNNDVFVENYRNSVKEYLIEQIELLIKIIAKDKDLELEKIITQSDIGRLINYSFDNISMKRLNMDVEFYGPVIELAISLVGKYTTIAYIEIDKEEGKCNILDFEYMSVLSKAYNEIKQVKSTDIEERFFKMVYCYGSARVGGYEKNTHDNLLVKRAVFTSIFDKNVNINDKNNYISQELIDTQMMLTVNNRADIRVFYDTFNSNILRVYIIGKPDTPHAFGCYAFDIVSTPTLFKARLTDGKNPLIGKAVSPNINKSGVVDSDILNDILELDLYDRIRYIADKILTTNCLVSHELDQIRLVDEHQQYNNIVQSSCYKNFIVNRLINTDVDELFDKEIKKMYGLLKDSIIENYDKEVNVNKLLDTQRSSLLLALNYI